MNKIPVLKIKDEKGNLIPINVIRGENGTDGKSAYEQAVEGGYKGTEEEFVAILNGLSEFYATADDLKKASVGMRAIKITSEDGITYTGTIDGLAGLTNGLTITVIPNIDSTTETVKLNINGIGEVAVGISASQEFGEFTWFYNDSLKANEAVQLVYTYNEFYGDYLWLTTKPRLDFDNINDGVLPVQNGGTGATTAKDARTNLGAAPQYSYGTSDLTAGSSYLETGKLYFVYE